MNAKFAGSLINFLAWLSTIVMFFMQISGDKVGWLVVFLPVIITTTLGFILVSLARVLENLE